jgi:hypothetical protein
MPLIKATLKQGLLAAYTNVGDTAAACADAIGGAVGAYASSVVPPCAAVTAATQALKSGLATAFAAGPGQGLALAETAFTAFGAAVAAGMAPAFTGSPPVGPLGFADQTEAINSADAACDMLAGLIHDWMTSGKAVANAPAPPPPVNWS